MGLVFHPEITRNVVLSVLNFELDSYEKVLEKKLNSILYLIETDFIKMTQKPYMGLYFHNKDAHVSAFFLDDKGNEQKLITFLKEGKYKGQWNLYCRYNQFSLMTTKKPAKGFFSPVSKRIIDHVFERTKEKTLLELEKQAIKSSRIFRDHMENYGRLL